MMTKLPGPLFEVAPGRISEGARRPPPRLRMRLPVRSQGAYRQGIVADADELRPRPRMVRRSFRSYNA
jgi:hypothetical protein